RRRQPTKVELAAENARLRRALASQARSLGTSVLSTTAEAGGGEATAALDAARAQQAATAEILRLIASSPEDPQPAFEAIARHAPKLCGGVTVLVTRYDGELLRLVAHENVAPERFGRIVERFPRPPDRTFPMGVAVLDRTMVHEPDLQRSDRFAG